MAVERMKTEAEEGTVVKKIAFVTIIPGVLIMSLFFSKLWYWDRDVSRVWVSGAQTAPSMCCTHVNTEFFLLYYIMLLFQPVPTLLLSLLHKCAAVCIPCKTSPKVAAFAL